MVVYIDPNDSWLNWSKLDYFDSNSIGIESMLFNNNDLIIPVIMLSRSLLEIDSSLISGLSFLQNEEQEKKRKCR